MPPAAAMRSWMRAPISTRAIPPNSERNIANFANCCPGSTSWAAAAARTTDTSKRFARAASCLQRQRPEFEEIPTFHHPRNNPEAPLANRFTENAPRPLRRLAIVVRDDTFNRLPTPRTFAGNRDAPEWKSMCSSCSGRCARSRSKGRGRRKIDPRYAGREKWLRARACKAMAICSKFRIFLSS